MTLKSSYMKDLVKTINSRLTMGLFKIKEDIKSTKYIFHDDTYHSLIDGELRKHFGFPRGTEQSFVNPVIDAVYEDMRISMIPFTWTGHHISGEIKLELLNENLRSVLDIPQGSFITEKGDTLDWLHWFLLEGNKIIIQDYMIILRDGAGRSHGAIMRPKDGKSWSVPPEYAGTIKDNWLTRVLDSQAQVINTTFVNSVKALL